MKVVLRCVAPGSALAEAAMGQDRAAALAALAEEFLVVLPPLCRKVVRA